MNMGLILAFSHELARNVKLHIFFCNSSTLDLFINIYIQVLIILDLNIIVKICQGYRTMIYQVHFSHKPYLNIRLAKSAFHALRCWILLGMTLGFGTFDQRKRCRRCVLSGKFSQNYINWKN